MDQKFWNTLLDRTSNALTQAAKVLGQASSHIYEVLVRQQIVEGVGTLLWIGFCAVVLIVLWKTVFSNYWRWTLKKEHQADTFSSGNYMVAAILVSLTTLSLVLFSTYLLGEAVKHILNPEFYAISYIFNQVKPQQ